MLFDAVSDWAAKEGLTEIVGPLGYSDLEREGLLIDGFDKLQTYEEQYNYDYYQTLIEHYGFVKDVDWIEYKLYPPKKVDERIERLTKKIEERRNIRVYQPKSIRKFIKEYRDQFFEMIDTTYSKLYGTVPFTKEMMESSISNFMLLLRPQDIVVVLNKDNKMVGFALMFPSISEVVTKYKGKIGLRFIIDFFKNKKHPKVIDLGLIGVLPEYSAFGVAAILINVCEKNFIKESIEHLETNLMLEENLNILSFMENFTKEYTKRRRCFKKTI